MIDHERTNFPVCPHCGHKLTDDEVHASGVDVWALAPDEGDDELDCPACGKHYYIKGFYVPEYTTSRHNCDVCDGDADCTCEDVSGVRAVDEAQRCGNDKTPPGWACSREKGHKGPCAAHPEEDQRG